MFKREWYQGLEQTNVLMLRYISYCRHRLGLVSLMNFSELDTTGCSFLLNLSWNLSWNPRWVVADFSAPAGSNVPIFATSLESHPVALSNEFGRSAMANLATAFDGEGVFVCGWLKLSVGWEWLTFHILFGRCFLKYVFVARIDLLIHPASWPFLYKLWFLELILLNFPKLQKLVVVMPDTSPQMGFSCQVPSGLTQPCTLVPKRGHEPVWRHWNISFWKDQGIGPAWKPIAAKESHGEYIYIYICENPLVNTWCCFF